MTILNEPVISFRNKSQLIFFLIVALLVTGTFYIDRLLVSRFAPSIIILDALLPSKN